MQTKYIDCTQTQYSQPRPKYIFNKCGTNIYFFYSSEYGGLVHHHHRIFKKKQYIYSTQTEYIDSTQK